MRGRYVIYAIKGQDGSSWQMCIEGPPRLYDYVNCKLDLVAKWVPIISKRNMCPPSSFFLIISYHARASLKEHCPWLIFFVVLSRISGENVMHFLVG